jgi:predicted alpha/beta hydrolase
MQRSETIRRAASTAALLVCFPLFAAQPYHLELEASPAAVFPYLGRFGDVELHVYAGGVRVEALWLNGFSRNGASDVTVMNPLGRMYVDFPIRDIAPTLAKLAGKIERQSVPTLGPSTKGTVSGIEATRHRLVYGEAAWVDVWTTTAVPENAQLRQLVNGLLQGISPGTARVASKLAGTPVYVELNFRRFRKVPLIKMKKLVFNAEDETDALTRGPIYMRASVLEKLF